MSAITWSIYTWSRSRLPFCHLKLFVWIIFALTIVFLNTNVLRFLENYSMSTHSTLKALFKIWRYICDKRYTYRMGKRIPVENSWNKYRLDITRRCSDTEAPHSAKTTPPGDLKQKLIPLKYSWSVVSGMSSAPAVHLKRPSLKLVP